MRPLLAAILALAVAPDVAAAVLKVPKQFSTIQAAVDAASPGDTISIGKGTFDEEVVIDQRTDLELVGKGKKTVVRAFVSRPFSVTDSQRIVLRKMRLRALDAANLGVLLGGCSECQVRDCRIDLDEFGGGLSVGVYVGAGTDTLVNGNRIERFEFGVMAEEGLRATIIGNEISNYSVGIIPAFKGGVDADALIADNVMTGEHSDVETGTGIWVFGLAGQPASVFGNRVEGTETGVRVEGAAHVLDDNRVKYATTGFSFLFSGGSELSGNRVDACDVGFTIDAGTDGVRLADNRTKKAAVAAFRTSGTGGVFVGNAAKKSKALDLEDLSAGGNIYVGNDFGNVVLP